MSGPILVTGASGWLGRRLVRALADGLADDARFRAPTGQPVRCLLMRPEDRELLGDVSGPIECVVGDITSPESLGDFFGGAEGSTLFHTAGLIHPRSIRELYAVNDKGTENLLRESERVGVRRFVHVSSNSPMGCNPSPDHRFDEESAYRPYLNYGRSKKIAEERVAAAGRSGRLETVTIRPPWFYGPGQPARQTTFFRMVRDGRVPLIGGGRNVRSMAYIDNICQGLLLCAKVPEAAGRTYWIADERPYTMREIVETVAEVLEQEFGIACKPARLELPGLVGGLALWTDRLIQGLGFYSQQIHVLGEMNKNIACSIDRATRELGYAPTVDLREGMRLSVADLLAREERI